MAKRFSPYLADPSVVIFASGVSDSKSIDAAQYLRERNLLKETIGKFPDATLVYFSTCSIYDPYLKDNPYIRHKLEIEKLLAASGNKYLLLRVSNVAGPGGNPKTIFNYLAHFIRHSLYFKLWKQAYRNLIDVDDVFLLTRHLLNTGTTNTIVNIAHPSTLSMPFIVKTFEEYFQKQGNFVPVEAGYYFHFDTSLVQTIAKEAGVDFEGDYLYRLLEKYYPLV